MMGAIIADALPLVAEQLARSEANTLAIAGYAPLSDAWSYCPAWPYA
jgi:hypothetical protein